VYDVFVIAGRLDLQRHQQRLEVQLLAVADMHLAHRVADGRQGALCDLDRLLVAVHEVQLIEDLLPREGSFQDLKDQLQQLTVARLGWRHFTLDQLREVFAGR
jgi:hypothetical protein